MNFSIPLEGQLSIAGRILPISIDNLSAGGLGFKHEYSFPLNRKLVFQFSFTINETPFVVEGFIKRKGLTDEDGIFDYGVQFIADKEKRILLAHSINEHEIKMRRKVAD